MTSITRPFYIGKYPITQAQWQAVMQDGHQSIFPTEAQWEYAAKGGPALRLV